ncbi:MAG: HAD-IB family phosphatase [Candidatus Omnitrophota bacterium]|nr:HAD-IB family phosphatase [Candidatus Omnitrophota bacterium]MBU1894926.1 HAD-IB family phosphatase [Candidatus Omnitrophota bacterium]
MKYKLIIFDIDGTITRHISSWRYIHEKLGLWDVLAKKYQEEFLAGKISYREFCELDAAHWKGIKLSKMRQVFKNVKYSKNVEKVIKLLKKNRFKLAAVSTGLQFIAERVKNELKFDYVKGNRLNVYKGRLSGKVKINISHGAKGSTVKMIAEKFRVKKHEIISVGDTEGDLPMVKQSGYSMAFNSSSLKLSRAVDYVCKTTDFMEVYDKIVEISGQ